MSSSAIVVEPDLVVLGDTALVRMNDDSAFFAVVLEKNSYHVRQREFKAASLIGCQYGEVYEVQPDGSLTFVESGELLERIDYEVGSGADNRHTTATAKTQMLTHEEIVSLKESGVSGGKLITTIISNSSSFANKTAFAQEKYIKKKQLKHVIRFRVLRPTAPLICDALVANQTGRLCGLRGDGLGHLLAAANIRYGGRAIIFDETGGVVLGAAIEKMGGVGTIFHPLEDQFAGPMWTHVEKYNLGHLLRKNNSGSGATASTSSSSGAVASSSKRLNVITIQYDQLGRWGQKIILPNTKAAQAAMAAEPLRVTEARQRAAEAKRAAAAAWKLANSGADGDLGDNESGTAAADSAAGVAPKTAAESAAPAPAKAKAPQAQSWRVAAKKKKVEETEKPAAPAAAPAPTSAEAPPAASAPAPASAAAMEEDDNKKAEATNSAGAGGKPAFPVSATNLHRLKPTPPSFMSDTDKRFLLQEGCESILIVSDSHPAPLALAAARFASPSASIAIFCRELQPLAECNRQLRALGIGMHLVLSETFYRPQQVLPARTHPEMIMHGASGYVLRGCIGLHPYSAVYAAIDPQTLAAAAAKGALPPPTAAAVAEPSVA